MIKKHNDILAYQRSKSLYPKTVKLAKSFSALGFHLRDQLCRAANSIHANIAEGFGRSAKEFKMYLTRALGSCNETISHLEDAINAEFVNNKNEAKELIEEYTVVGKQIYRLRQSWTQTES